ncbi:hypothetical protein PpBr36_07813 [Pyricularia pennisetigena]|uniref:hypothetical protein n=1 Tax=Pyricularia pennisetigena TaxID=1578925 RepID=UPI0011500EB8|nr:hypothetical protein PpBr36_07813 [Pyricularia pennisetigena]TLS25452.1 hypothetical protein PpBr36_07813 [Pyricularia pennisetigena]
MYEVIIPNKASGFLTPRGQAHVLDRIDQDRGDAEQDKATGAKIFHHLPDCKSYFWAFNLLASAMPSYALAFFMPIILTEGMGFSTAHSMLLMTSMMLRFIIDVYFWRRSKAVKKRAKC